MAASGSRPEFSTIRSMKRPGLTPPLASATLFMIIAALPLLRGQDIATGAMSAKGTKRADEVLKRYDKNGDGKIDDDERAEAKEVMMKDQIDRQMGRANALPGGLESFRAQTLELFDKNRDGRLDEAERAAAQKFVAIRDEAAVNASQLAKQFDKNGDGTIDATEQAALENFIRELRSLGSSNARAELLRMFDRNSDGKIDNEEFVEVEKFVRPRIESAPAQLRLHDANKDGMLDDKEWNAARPAILKWLNESEAPAAVVPTPAQEQARLNAVADEVARRRAVREAAIRAVPPAK